MSQDGTTELQPGQQNEALSQKKKYKKQTVFVLHSVDMMYHIDVSIYVELSFHLWSKSHLFLMNDHFNILLNSVCQYFVNCLSIFIRDIDL